MSAVVDNLLTQIKVDVAAVATGLKRVEEGEWSVGELATLPAACVVFDSIELDEAISTPYRSFGYVNVAVIVYEQKQPQTHGYTTVKAYHRDVLKALCSSTYQTHSSKCYHTFQGDFDILDAEQAKVIGFVQQARCLVSWQWDDPDSV